MDRRSPSEFQIGGHHYASPDPEDDPDHTVIDERLSLLQKALDGMSSFGYLYDFGTHTSLQRLNSSSTSAVRPGAPSL